MPNRKLNVFLCHAKEDKPTVRELYRQLTAEGWMDVWLDEENLFPGQEWDMEIEKAVEAADVVIVCLSSHSVDKEGYVQKELRFVLNIADEKPEGTIFVVPVRLDECQVPRRIRAWQYVDYFPKGRRKIAYQRLLESLKLRAGKLSVPVGRIANPTYEPVDDETAKAERERKAREERERLATQKAENDRIAREKAEAERVAKAKGDRLLRLINQQAEERKKATTEAFSKTNFKRIFAIGGIGLALLALFFIGRFVIENLPIIPTPIQSSQTSEALADSPTIRPTEQSSITSTTELRVGSTWTSPKDGMVMMFVPAGEFSMGSENGARDEKPVHTVYLNSYWIDKTEVTNAMYAKCVETGKCNPPSSSSSSMRSSYYGNLAYTVFPVIANWYDAKTYCEWRGDGARLPTEAEWEKAASWDDDKKEKRVYPWGNSVDCLFSNYWGRDLGCVGDTTKIGSYPKGVNFYGLQDMAGNVWEWVSSLYQTYPYNASDGRENLFSSGNRVLRGGSYYSGDQEIRSSVRWGRTPYSELKEHGFRCARSLP